MKRYYIINDKVISITDEIISFVSDYWYDNVTFNF